MPGRIYTSHPPLNPSSNASRPTKRKKTDRRILNAFAIAQHTASNEYIPRRARLGEIEGAEAGAGKQIRDDESSGEGEDGDSGEDGERGQLRKRRRSGDVDGGSDSEGNEWVVGVGEEDSEIDSDEAGSVGSAGEESEAESEGFAAEAVELGDVLDGESSEEDESDQDDEDEDLDLSDQGDDADAHRLAKLKNLLVGLDGQNNKQRSQLDLAQEAATPSEYGLAPKQKLSVADLMASITDPALKKSLKVLAGDGKKGKATGVPGKLSAPLPRRQQDRIDRTAAFEKSKETLSRWIETVKHNRRAEHLVFPLVDQDVEAAKSTKRIVPATSLANELETTIQKILADSGLEPGKKQEDEIQKFEEFATNKLPIEEVRARQAELRKARDLLFREEIRAKRIKRIKSKSYRRVHRKEQERNALREKDALAEAGLLPSEDEQERLDRRRAEERMGQRHRESRWAKSIKESGRATWDDEARDGVAAMLKQDEELKRRMHGKDADSESESDSEPSEEDEEAEEAFTQRMHDKLARLGTTEARQESKLSSMRFMQKAEAARRARNEEALEQLHRELDGGSELESDNEDNAISGRRAFGPKKRITPITTVKTKRAEFEEGEESDQEHPIQDDVEIVVNGAGQRNGNAKKNGSSKSKETPMSTARVLTQQSNSNPINASTGAEEENPFLTVKKQSKKKAPESSIIISSEAQLSIKNSHPKSAPILDPIEVSDSDASFTGFSPPSSPKITAKKPLDQKALIAQAFAADQDLILHDFTSEKATLSQSEAPSRSTTSSLPGWGSWIGPGLSRKDKRASRDAATQQQTSHKPTPSSEGIPTSQRKDKSLDRVIISEKRQSKTAKYLAPALPHPFESKAQYERSLRLPIGPEFTTKVTFQKMTKPRVINKGGIVRPMRKPLV